MRRIWSARYRGALIGLAAAVVAWTVVKSPLAGGLDDWFFDACLAARDTRPSTVNVLLVGIDDAFLDERGKPLAFLSPELAEVVAYLDRQGAAAIGLDVLIPQSMTAMPELQDRGSGDATRLGYAIDASGRVVLPVRESATPSVRPLVQWQLRALTQPDPNGADFGFVDLTEDGDQMVRRQQLVIRINNEMRLQFALALLAKAGTKVEWNPDSRRLTLDGTTVPLDDEQKLRINYVGPPGSFRPVPLSGVYADLKAGRLFPAATGAVVIIGRADPGGQDVHATPYANRYARYLFDPGSGLMPGPEVHANVLATLHDRAFLTTPWWLATLPMLLLTGAVLGFAYDRLSLGGGLTVAVVFHFAWKALAVAVLSSSGWRVPIVPMLLLGALAYAAVFVIRWRVLRQVLRAVKSSPIAKALEADPSLLRRGESRVVTVLFADLRGFTQFSNGRPAAEVIELLNAYFGAVVPTVDAAGGVVDKFIGDGLMAVFGGLGEDDEHAIAGVKAAAEMVRAVRQREHMWTALGFKGMKVGIGVHTGPAVVGAVGSRNRLDFTTIGDTVNVASRIEAATKDEKVELLISAATVAALTTTQRLELGIRPEPRVIRPKGVAEPLEVYAVEVR